MWRRNPAVQIPIINLHLYAYVSVNRPSFWGVYPVFKTTDYFRDMIPGVTKNEGSTYGCGGHAFFTCASVETAGRVPSALRQLVGIRVANSLSRFLTYAKDKQDAKPLERWRDQKTQTRNS